MGKVVYRVKKEAVYMHDDEQGNSENHPDNKILQEVVYIDD